MQKDEQQKKDLLTIGEASEYLGISIDTLRRWEKKGRIEPFRSPGGHRYFNKKDLDDLFGKRYTRDEETIRRSFKKEVESITTPNTDEISKKENITIEPIPTPVVGLPHWRAIKENDYPEEIIENEVTKTEILDRPAREVKIPDNTSIRIINSEASVSSEEAYFRQQSVSVLTPQNISVASGGISQTQMSKNNINSILPKINVSNLPEDDRKFYIFLGVLTLIVILSIIWYVVWRNSQTVLSPIP